MRQTLSTHRTKPAAQAEFYRLNTETPEVHPHLIGGPGGWEIVGEAPSGPPAGVDEDRHRDLRSERDWERSAREQVR